MSGPDLRLLGASYRVAGLSEREEMIARSGDAVRELRGRSDAFILTTCNRVELYYISDEEMAPEAFRPFLGSMYRMSGLEAFAHLVKVAAGLDSLVPGEEGIVYQIRRQLRVQEREGGVGRLSQVVRQAVAIARELRASVGISGGEIVNALMDEALRRVKGRDRAAIVGSGRTAKLVYQRIRGEFKEVYVASRRPLMSSEFPGAIRARPEEVDRGLGGFNLVVSATNTEVGRYMIKGSSAPMPGALLIDLSVPRTIAPSLRGLAELWDMDDAVRIINGSAASGAEPAQGKIMELAAPAYFRLRYRKMSPELAGLMEGVQRMIEAQVREAIKAASRGDLEGAMRKLAERAVKKALAYVLSPPHSEEELKSRLEVVRRLLEGLSGNED